MTARPATLADVLRAWLASPRIRRLSYDTRRGYRLACARYRSAILRTYAPQLRGREPDRSYLDRDVVEVIAAEVAAEHGASAADRLASVVARVRRDAAADLEADDPHDEVDLVDEDTDDAAE